MITDTWVLFLLAAIMAVVGVIGYKQGFKSMLIALIVLFVATLIIQRGADTIIRYMNGLFLGASLVFKSGLNDIASGDLESAAAKLESTERPFEDEGEWFAYLLILAGAVFVGWLITLIGKNQPSIWGLLVGLLYGYVLSAALLPLIFGFSSDWFLPIFGVGESQAVSPLAGAQCQGFTNQLKCFLSDPRNAQICGIIVVIAIAVFILWAARITTRATAPKKG